MKPLDHQFLIPAEARFRYLNSELSCGNQQVAIPEELSSLAARLQVECHAALVTRVAFAFNKISSSCFRILQTSPISGIFRGRSWPADCDKWLRGCRIAGRVCPELQPDVTAAQDQEMIGNSNRVP